MVGSGVAAFSVTWYEFIWLQVCSVIFYSVVENLQSFVQFAQKSLHLVLVPFEVFFVMWAYGLYTH